MPGLKPSQEDIEQFVAITQASHEDALQFLVAGTTLEGAIEDYYAAQTAAAPAPSAIEADDPDFDIEEPIMSDPNQSAGGPRTLGGEAAEPLPAGWGKPEKSRFGRIQHNDGGRDQDSDDKDPEELYAGGGKSGLAVQNPDQPKSGNSTVDNILRLAKQNGPSSPGPRAAGPTSSGGAFRGTGNTLGSDETPSTEVVDPSAARSPRAGRAPIQPNVRGATQWGNDNDSEDEDDDDDSVQTRRLTFWRTGFSIEDGPLLLYDDPANQQLLQAIEAGRAPPSVFGVRFNQRLNVEVAQRRREEYQPPPKKPAKPFGGSGNRLGAATPEIASPMPGSMPTGILVGGSSGTATPSASSSGAGVTGQSKFEVDESKPTTSVQLRLGDGTRLVARVNLDHTVGDLRNYVSASRPDYRSFVLQTTFPSRELSDASETVESAKLQNAVVVQRFT